MNQSNLSTDRTHADTCHRRWLERRNRKQESERYREEWWAEQCGHCKYFIPLMGVLGADYGACTNPSAAFDGMVRFEHDGCVEFTATEEWVEPQPTSRF